MAGADRLDRLLRDARIHGPVHDGRRDSHLARLYTLSYTRCQMPIESLNGANICCESHGTAGPRMVLVHGSWGDRHDWDKAVPDLSSIGRVVTYDRRGFGESDRVPVPRSLRDEVRDLAALIEHRRASPAHIIANSFGAIITLNLLIDRPDLVASAAIHEPPLIGLLEDPDAPAQVRSYINDADDRAAYTIDLKRLGSFGGPLMMSRGTQSPRLFDDILDIIGDALPRAQRYTFRGAGHVPHLTHPADYTMVIGAYVSGVADASSQR